MLEWLRIKDFVVIEEVEIEFGKGFNVFSGETGAGKSIILGAIDLILGGRADTSKIRPGATKTTIEAVFRIENAELIKKLKEQNIELNEDNTLIIRREVYENGKNKCFINGNIESVNKLSEITEGFVEIHGQHQHQLLLHKKNHIKFLDMYGKLEEEVKKFSEQYKKVLEKKQELEELQRKAQDYKERYEMNKYILEELKELNVREGEEEELEKELEALSNFEKIYSAISQAYSLIYESEPSSIGNLEQAIRHLQTAKNYISSLPPLIYSLEKSLETVKAVTSELEKIRNKLEYNPQRIEEIAYRLTKIRDILRKYRVKDTKELLEFMKKVEMEVSKVENYDEELGRLQEEYNKELERLKNMALELSKKRQQVGKKMEKEVEAQLKELGMEHAEFKVDIKYYQVEDGLIELSGKRIEVTEEGIDKVEFLITTNPGMPLGPLNKIASGGELSRTMLAIRVVLANVDNIDTLIFDEIDAGIGGKIGKVVGEKLRKIAEEGRQVIVITHLPQIASKAHKHFVVRKEIKGNKPVTYVKELEYNERVQEIARMLSGDITESSIKHAEELLSKL